jgi:hypothetical protein
MRFPHAGMPCIFDFSVALTGGIRYNNKQIDIAKTPIPQQKTGRGLYHGSYKTQRGKTEQHEQIAVIHGFFQD